MDVLSWARKIHENATAHGWHETRRSSSACADLFHSELSEALEEYRGDRPMVYGIWNEGVTRIWTQDQELIRANGLKPEGIAIELIDCVIRILDYAYDVWGEKGPHNTAADWQEFCHAIEDEDFLCDIRDLTLEGLLANCHYYVSIAWKNAPADTLASWPLMDCMSLICNWLRTHGHDPEELMELKHNYNKGRDYRHGGKKL